MNPSLSEVKNKLQEIHDTEREPFLFPYLQQLFVKLGYLDVEITHGRDEFGKDLVFLERDERLLINKFTAVIVKNKDARQNDFVPGGEIYSQIYLCFNHPFLNSNGINNQINNIIIVINGAITFNAKQILSTNIEKSLLANIQIWNYQKLGQFIFKNISDTFLSQLDPKINKFLKYQEVQFLSLNNKKDFYKGLNIIDINDIYVNARTTLKKYQETKDKYSLYGEKSKTHLLEDQDDSIHIAKSSHDYIIHGMPTSGKTLLLFRIGYNSIYIGRSKPIIPFYIELGKIQDFRNFSILQEICNQYLNATNGDVVDFSKYSKVCILLDGFDEILKEENKIFVVNAVKDFKNIFVLEHSTTPLQLILTSRDIRYFETTDVFNNFEKIELLPFDIGQAFKLVNKLIPNNKIKTDKFIKAIKNNQLSNSLTRTPMALSLMAILYKDSAIDLDELPANITELYNKFTDYYLNRWDIEKGISLQYKFEETKYILSFIAKELHRKGTASISYDELKIFLSNLRTTYDYEDLKNLDDFLYALQTRVGLVYFDDKDCFFYFNHLAFQEYFTSISFDDSNEDELIDNYFSDWWSNVIIFYCGKQPRRDIFLKKVKQKLIPITVLQYISYLTLMSKCIQASYLISSQSRIELIESIIVNFGKCYDEIITFEKNNESGYLYLLTTIDFIIQYRDFFIKLFNSKHINYENIKEIGMRILSQENSPFSDVTLYSIAYFLAKHENNSLYLEAFVQLPALDPRWQRIVYIDIQNLQNVKNLNEKLFRKLKQKQRKNKDYIVKQFKSPAYKYLLPIVKD